MLIEVSTPHQEAIAKLKGHDLHLLMQADRAQGVRHRLLPCAIEPGDESFQDNAALEVFDELLPTYFFIKLSALADRTVDLLWQGRFPSRDPNSLSINDKLAELDGVANFHRDSISKLKRIRNACAHEFLSWVTWEHFYQHQHTLTCVLTLLWRETFGDNDVIRTVTFPST